VRAQLTAALAALLVLAFAQAALAGEPLPAQGAPPPGANDFSCKPPPRHPYPVVLVHGTFGNMTVSWNEIAPDLERLGYCVFALDYGNNATGDIPKSAGQLQTFVDDVLAKTGASKVSIVGHSQGGMMPRYLIKFAAYSSKVDDLVGMSPSNHGTTNPLAGPAAQFGCVACAQQAAGSDFITHLNAGDQTPAPVSYTVIETRNDEVVTPYDSEFLPETSDGRVTNVLLQDACPADPTDHVGIIYDPIAIQWMLHALGRPGPADPLYEPDCTGQRARSFPDSPSVGGGGGTSGQRTAGSGQRRPRLIVGGVRRHGKRLWVALDVRGGTVRGVVVTVRRGKRVVARSKKVTVKKRRVVKLRIRRHVAAGKRYRVIAHAPASSAARSFRLRR
jgi:triacylglycerol esterase/lipase EstA (alpha/beta hydrolase family)